MKFMIMDTVRNCKIHEDWFLRCDNNGTRISEWAEQKTENDFFCTVCSITISCKSKGFQSMIQHADSQSHIKNFKLALSQPKLNLTVVPENRSLNEKQSTSFCGITKKNATISEILWCLKLVRDNLPAASCDGTNALFRRMFSDSTIAKQFELGRTKCGYFVTDAIGPYFKKLTVNDVGQEYFSLLYDETVNNEKVKELQIRIRYFSSNLGRVVTRHLETFFISHATAEVISQKLREAVNNADLIYTRIVSLGSDGPNVNKKVCNVINSELIQLRGWGLANIGSCYLHVIHNSFLKGLTEFGMDVNDLIINIYHFFDGYPVRVEEFKSVQQKVKCPVNSFIKHVPTRWLTILPAAERLLEQWPAIIEYFCKYIPLKKPEVQKNCRKYLTIHKFLKEKSMKGQIIFIIESATIFQAFTSYFQKDEPIIHKVYDEIVKIIRTIGAKICNNMNQSLENIFESSNIVNTKDVKRNIDVDKEILHYSEKDRLWFLHNVKKHYLRAGQYVLDKLKSCQLLKNVVFIDPINVRNVDSFDKLKVFLLNDIKVPQHLSIETSWSILQSLNFPEYTDGSRIDLFWNNIFQLKDLSKDFKTFIKMVLCLSHGNAEVERGFSRSKLVLDENQTRMSERTLNARLYAIDGLKLYGDNLEIIPISDELIKMCKFARQNYQRYLDSEKKKKENEIENAKKAEVIEQARQELTVIRNSVESLMDEERAQEEKKDIKNRATDTLLQEINKKLDIALDNSDFAALEHMKTLVSGVLNLRKQEKQVDCVIKNIEKRKNNLITTYFNKKPRNK